MRVPEAKSTARVNNMPGVTASAEAFGAGVGRAVEGFGNTVERQGEKLSDIAIQMKANRVKREAEDAYGEYHRQANEIYLNEVQARQGAQTDDLLEDGFEQNFTAKLDEAFTKVGENLSDNARQRYGVMVQPRRMAMETMAARHIFQQQDFARKQSTAVAVDSALTGYSNQVQAFIGKNSDGTVQVDMSQIERVLPDVIAAQNSYNAARGIVNEVDLPDGSKRNVLHETARAMAHQKAVAGLVASSRFDEADAYLDTITGSEKYKGDLDEEQVKLSRDAISKARENDYVLKQNESNVSLVNFVIKNGRAPNANESAELKLTDETIKGLKDTKQIDPTTPEYAEAPETLDYYEFLTRVNRYDAKADPTGEKIRALAVEATGFGSGSERALKEVQEAYTGTNANQKIGTETKKAVKRRILGMISEAAAGDANIEVIERWGPDKKVKRLDGKLVSDAGGSVSTSKSTGELYELYARLVGFAENLAEDANLNETQYIKAIEEHPVFVHLQDVENLSTYATDFYEYAGSGLRGGTFGAVPVEKDFSSDPVDFDPNEEPSYLIEMDSMMMPWFGGIGL